MTASRTIILMGLRGAGKSTIGAAVAKAAGWPRVEIDDLAAARLAARDAGDAIRTRGLPAFREAESAALGEALAASSPCVICLGGGTPTAPGAADMLRAARTHATIVYLRATPTTLRHRLAATDLSSRPSLTGRHPLDEVDEVFAARDTLYRELTGEVIEVDQLGEEAIVIRVMQLAS